MNRPITNQIDAAPEVAVERLLTPREREVLAGLALGLSNRVIAARLCLAEKTIKNRVTDILSKLQVTNRTQAACWALEHGVNENDFPRS